MNRIHFTTTVASLALGITVFVAPPSFAILPSEAGSSETSGSSSKSSNIGLSIGKAIEKVAATISQIVSPQPADSIAAQKAFKPIPKVVCSMVVTYVIT